MALDKDHSEAVATTADAQSRAEDTKLDEAFQADWDADEEALTSEEYAAWEAACAEESRRRMADFRAGRTTAAPWEEVKARLLARFG